MIESIFNEKFNSRVYNNKYIKKKNLHTMKTFMEIKDSQKINIMVIQYY